MRRVCTLVLWDIDHTLVDVGSLGRVAYEAAFVRVTRRPLERLAVMTGRTDRSIMIETFALHGLEASEASLHEFGSALATEFAARVHLCTEVGRVLPGAAEALAALDDRAGVLQSVLTGNMARIAVGKLSAFGLDRYVDFEVGAFGLDDSIRANLVAIARRRTVAKYGSRWSTAAVVLVGDTPSDVEAGHVGGARVVAVASGGSGVAELRAAGADVVLSDLVDTRLVVEAVTGG